MGGTSHAMPCHAIGSYSQADTCATTVRYAPGGHSAPALHIYTYAGGEGGRGAYSGGSAGRAGPEHGDVTPTVGAGRERTAGTRCLGRERGDVMVLGMTIPRPDRDPDGGECQTATFMVAALAALVSAANCCFAMALSWALPVAIRRFKSE